MSAIEHPAVSAAECPAGLLLGLDRSATKVFKGITFATARRFGAPTDVFTWSGVLDASTFGAQAPQNGGTLERLLGGSSIPQSEDCLSLNVYTPALDDELRPVLVWVHGGAFMTGGGAMPWYDGSRLATRGDVVVVTVNYRLGALGFLGERNGGTLDQVSALRWVQRNIASFGGDPGNVTVFGESAGGSAAIALTATPTADGLFHRAWAMSPSILQLRMAEQGRRFEDEYLALIGATSVDHLRERPVGELLTAQATMAASAGAGLKIFSPTDGTASIPEPIRNVVTRDNRPLVIGTNRDESNLFTAFDQTRADWTDDDVDREFGQRFAEMAPAAIDAYRAHAPNDGSGPTNSANRLVTMMQSDELFRWPAWELAGHRADAGSPTWMYGFDYVSTAFGGVLGSAHGLDIPFAFDNLHRPGVEMFTGDRGGRQAIADQFATAILAFARTGEPGWVGYDDHDRRTQRIGPDPVVVSDPDKDLHALWASARATSR
jgi:para-nitrobenzyl esterase